MMASAPCVVIVAVVANGNVVVMGEIIDWSRVPLPLLFVLFLSCRCPSSSNPLLVQGSEAAMRETFLSYLFLLFCCCCADVAKLFVVIQRVPDVVVVVVAIILIVSVSVSVSVSSSSSVSATVLDTYSFRVCACECYIDFSFLFFFSFVFLFFALSSRFFFYAFGIFLLLSVCLRLKKLNYYCAIRTTKNLAKRHSSRLNAAIERNRAILSSFFFYFANTNTKRTKQNS